MFYYNDFFDRDALRERIRKMQEDRDRYKQGNPIDEYEMRQAGTEKEAVKVTIISKPVYYPPERRTPKFRRHSVNDLEITLIAGMHMAAKVMNLVHQSPQDTIFIAVEGEGIEYIPDTILQKIARGQVVLQLYHGQYYEFSRRIKREFWTMRRLLWECLKESQYVDFEEV